MKRTRSWMGGVWAVNAAATLPVACTENKTSEMEQTETAAASQ